MSVARLRAALAEPSRIPEPRRLPVFLVTLVGLGLWALADGVRMASDSAAYGYWADRLIASGFDYPTLIAEAHSTYPAALYVLFVGLLAILKLLFGSSWAAALVVVNVISQAALAALLVRVVRRATGSRLAAWAGWGLFLGCHDLLQWLNVVSTDAIFFLLAFGAFALAAAGARPLAGLGLGAISAFYRPPGVILAPALAVGLWLSRRTARPRTLWLLLLLGGAALAAGILLFAWILQDPARWPFDALSWTVSETSRYYGTGEVVSARLETYHGRPVTMLDYAAITADRFVHFFQVTAPAFSLSHSLVQLAFFGPAYLLALWFLVEAGRGRIALDPIQRRIFTSAAVTILAFAVFHGIVQVDFDWRYRAPILPHLIVLAAGGIAALEARWAERRRASPPAAAAG